MRRVYWGVWLLASLAWGAPPPKMLVDFSGGKAHLETSGFHIPDERRRILEQEIGDTLAAQGLDKTHIAFEGPAVAKLAQAFQNQEADADEQVMLVVAPPGKRPQLDIIDKNSRMVMGGSMHVAPTEHLDLLVVLGGEAEIAGRVERLVQMGGKVHVTPTGDITGQLVSIGGKLEVDPAAHVTGKKMGWTHAFDFEGLQQIRNMWHHQKERLQTQVFGSQAAAQWAYWMWSCLVWGLMAGLAVLAQQLFPRHFARVQNHLLGRFLGNFLWSFLAAVILLGIGVALILSLVGLFLVPVLVGVTYLLYWLAQAHVAARIGCLILPRHVGAAVFVGLVALHLLADLPYFGLGYWLAVMISFGSLFREMGFHDENERV